MHRTAALGALATLLLAPAAARADTIAFRRGGDVWLMRPDGGGQRAVTHGERAYESPSGADDGTLLAAGPDGRLYRFTQRGVPVGEPVPTAATFASEDFPAEAPNHVRLSPDGRAIAYDEDIDGDLTTLWTPADSGFLQFPGQSLGQEDLRAPSWIGSDRLLLSPDVAPADGDPDLLAVYALGDGDDSAAPWFADTASTWATGFTVVTARSGARLAILEEDAAENAGVPAKLVIRLFSGPGPGLPPTFRCEIALPPDDAYDQAGPTFSPDGTRLAWAQADGIHVAALSDDCAQIKDRVVTGPGAWEPYWTPAADAVGPNPAPGAATLALKVTARLRPRRSTVLRRGVAARVTCSAGCVLTAALGLRGRRAGRASRTLDAAGATFLHVRLNRRARRVLARRRHARLALRVRAPGATPVKLTIRPRRG